MAALAGHYAIGIALALVYVIGAGWLGIPPDSFLAALGYGFATSVFPWFLVMPSLGFGVFGLNGPPELKLFRSSLLNHLSYGLGLWWTAKVLPLG
jgi:integral membrane sensor domain MASE1